MLKKVMIICIVFSFVFIGGIAFATNEEPEAVQEGVITQESEQSSGDIAPPPPPPPTELNTEGDKLEKGQQPEEAEAEGDGDGHN